MDATYAACLNCDRVNRVALSGGKKPVCGACRAELPFEHGTVHQSASALGILVRKSPLPVVVDFWAPWCGPCRNFAPIFEATAQRKAGQLVFAKVNTEQYPLASDAYGIRGIPTLILFSGGLERARQSGALPGPLFEQWIRNSLGAHEAA